MMRSSRAMDLAIHPEVYTIGWISTEFFLRGFEVIGRAHDDVLGGMIIMTMLRDALVDPRDDKPIGVRELARRLDTPFETVRRQVHKLVRSGACRLEEGGVCLGPGTLRSPRTSATAQDLSRSRSHARRAETDKGGAFQAAPIHRCAAQPQQGAGCHRPCFDPGAACRHEGPARLLRGRPHDRVGVHRIRAANVKHITNTAPGANRDILPDSDRRPVSMMAISNSMKLPYETIRRHTAKLMKQGKCVRFGRSGLVVPAAAYRNMTLEAGTVVQLVFDFMDELRASGIKI